LLRVFCLIIPIHLSSQSSSKDSLIKLLNAFPAQSSVTNDTNRCNILNKIISKENDEKKLGNYLNILKTLVEKNLKTSSGDLKVYYVNQNAVVKTFSASLAEKSGESQKSLELYNQALNEYKSIGNEKGMATVYSSIAEHYYNKDDYSNALGYYSKALELREKIKDKPGLNESLNNIATIHYNQGDIPKALDYFHQSLKLREEIGDKKGIAQSLNNLGVIYYDQNDFAMSLDYYLRALKIREESGDKKGVHQSLNNIGVLYYKQNNFSKALEYYNQSLKMREELNDKMGISESLNNIAVIYKKQNKFEQALQNFESSLKIREQINDTYGISNSLNNLARTYLALGITQSSSADKKKWLTKARIFADSSLQTATDLGFPDHLRNSEQVLFQIDSAMANGEGAYKHYKKYIFYRDSIVNEQTRKAGIKNQLRYEFEKKEAIIKEQQEKERAITVGKSRFQTAIIVCTILGLVIVLLFAFVIYRSLKTANRQKMIIEEKQKEILDSIRYAQRIQNSLLPSDRFIHRLINRAKSE
jgi:tetratricopeptide (TPR) repeat protein